MLSSILRCKDNHSHVIDKGTKELSCRSRDPKMTKGTEEPCAGKLSR